MADLFDVVIIGGGFSGVGLAREAAFHGFKTLLLESGTLCAGASANSLRIVHGGFRYLQTLAIDRVLQSSSAQQLALAQFPDLVKPLPCLMPLDRFGPKSALAVKIALALYNQIAKPPQALRGSVISSSHADTSAPAIRGNAPHGALKWWDALVLDPQALVEKIATEARGHGAEIRQNTSAHNILFRNSEAQVVVESSAGSSTIRSRVVINAAGPSINSVQIDGVSRHRTEWCRGFNILTHIQIDPTYAIAGKGRGRLLFAAPRDKGTAIGTWYLPMVAAGNPCEVTESELESALLDIKAAFPNNTIHRNDITAVECGVLPKGGENRHGEPIPLGREKVLITGYYAELLSTKFTTYQVQAATLLRRLAPLLQNEFRR